MASCKRSLDATMFDCEDMLQEHTDLTPTIGNFHPFKRTKSEELVEDREVERDDVDTGSGVVIDIGAGHGLVAVKLTTDQIERNQSNNKCDKICTCVNSGHLVEMLNSTEESDKSQEYIDITGSSLMSSLNSNLEEDEVDGGSREFAVRCICEVHGHHLKKDVGAAMIDFTERPIIRQKPRQSSVFGMLFKALPCVGSTDTTVRFCFTF